MPTCWKHISRLLFGAVMLLMLCLPAYTQNLFSAPDDERALDAATRGLCKVQVAMLGEIATHGDGHTLAFKVALVERLVDKCGFDTVLFEANQDEFIHLNQRIRSREAVTQDDLLTAVGGIWKFYREFQPLAPFLLTRAQSGRIFLGGMDDQLGQLGQNYANVDMMAGFVSLLPPSERQGCNAAFQQRIDYNYPADRPYSKLDQAQLERCLAEVDDAAHADPTVTGTAREDRQEMISATQRWISRDFSLDGEMIANRDRSMFQTFEWLQSQLPKKHKTIVWAATVHVAKQGDPICGDRVGTNLGSFIHHKYGKRARSVGFSALAGSFRKGKGRFLSIPVAPSDSIEVQALRGTSASSVYVGPKQLAAMGTSPGAFFYHSYQTLAWATFLDGVVVFRTEHPPTDVR